MVAWLRRCENLERWKATMRRSHYVLWRNQSGPAPHIHSHPPTPSSQRAPSCILSFDPDVHLHIKPSPGVYLIRNMRSK